MWLSQKNRVEDEAAHLSTGAFKENKQINNSFKGCTGMVLSSVTENGGKNKLWSLGT